MVMVSMSFTRVLSRGWRYILLFAVLLLLFKLHLSYFSTSGIISFEENAGRPPRQEVHFLLPIDDTNDPFCKSLMTALIHDFDPILLNFRSPAARKAKTADEKKELKIRGILNYVANNVSNPDSVIIMSDSMDVQWQVPVGELVDRYLQMEAPLVFSAEKNCFPPSPKWCDNIPSSPLPDDAYGTRTDTVREWTRPRWLNSGLFIGRAEYVQRVYEFAKELQTTVGPRDDQALMLYAYRLGTYNITLDFWSELFQSIATANEDIVWREADTGKMVANPEQWTPATDEEEEGEGGKKVSKEVKLEDPDLSLEFFHQLRQSRSSQAPKFPIVVATNKITLTVPAALHFNGRGKGLGKHYFAKGWWRRLGHHRDLFPKEAFALRRRIEQGTVRVAEDGRVIGWPELCGSLVDLDWLSNN